jgi:hypothetical protein
MADVNTYPGYDHGVGLSNVGSYQVSGKPYMSSSAVPASGAQPNHWKITFPAVTKEITIANNSNQTNEDVRFAFSERGLNDTVANYFLKHSAKDGVGALTINVKATELYLMSDGTHTPMVSVYAALTGIEPERVNKISTDGTNWSGSAGVG